MSLENAWEWSLRLACISLFLQGLEHIKLSQKTRRDRWSAILSLLRFPLLGVLFFAPFFEVSAAIASALFFLTYLNSMLWGGTYNGGSDSLTLLTWFLISLGSLTQRWEGALAGIAVLLSASYFLSGLSKLRVSSEWRNGDALGLVLHEKRYLSKGDRDQFSRLPRWVLRLFTWGTLSWELLFPLAWLGVPWVQAFLGIGLLFHLGNARYLGLNRFLWGWIAAYPALIFWVGKVQSAG